MKRAAGDFAVWLIIAIIVAVGKLWNKFVATQSDEEETPPTPPPVRRAARPQSGPVSSPAPPMPRPVITEPHDREDSGKDLRDFMERLTRPPQPKPVAAPAPPPKPPPAEPAAAPVAKTPVPEPPRRPSRWAEALRDRQNLRNIIISAEIIGPPRGA